MSLQTDIQRDWQFFDGVEDVTFTPRGNSEPALTGVKALRRAVSETAVQIFGGAIASPGTVVWHLWNDRGSGVDTLLDASDEPEPQDFITQANGTIWTITQVVYSPQTSRWQCLTVRQIGDTL